jgi:biotin carboxyl carrier protein
MRYFVTLDGQEFPLVLHDSDGNGRAQLAGSATTGASGAPGARAGAGVKREAGSAGASPALLQTEVLSPARPGRMAVVSVDGHVFRVLSGAPGPARDSSVAGSGRATINGHSIVVKIETELERRARPIRDKSIPLRTSVVAPMPGRVVKVSARVGDEVTAGQPLLGIEAMKMENELLSTVSGRVTLITVQPGSTVEADQELIVIEPV